MYGTQAHSYRDLPRRIADFGRLHRYERSGVVTGLTRVRTFSQDDAHIFCTPEQIEPEITALFDFIFEIYGLFGFTEVKVKLSTRPEKAIGDPAIWEHAERVLAACLDARDEVDYIARTRARARSTVPRSTSTSRTPSAATGSWRPSSSTSTCRSASSSATSIPTEPTKRPVMIHRAILGSLERFYGVMLEHFGGDLPPWLAPEQARVLPITDAVVGLRRDGGRGARPPRAAGRGRRSLGEARLQDPRRRDHEGALPAGGRPAGGGRRHRRAAAAAPARRGSPASRRRWCSGSSTRCKQRSLEL